MIIFCLSFVVAAPLNPATYWGYVQINNDTAEDGISLVLKTEAGEVLAEQILPFDEEHTGSYSIVASLDDPYTESDEGGYNGEGLSWYVNGIKALEPLAGEVVLEEGSVNNDFTIIGIKNPEIALSSTHSSKVMLGEGIDLTILLDNKGEGIALVDLVVDEIEGKGINEQGITMGIGEIIEKTIMLEPEECGEYSTEVHIDYYNQVGDKVDDTNSELKFEVVGPDLTIESMGVSSYSVEEGEKIFLSMFVKNIGYEDVGGFIVELYENDGTSEQKIEDIEIKSGLMVGEILTVTYDYDTTGKQASKNYKIKAKIVSGKKECDTKNNEIFSSVINLKEREAVEEIIVQEETVQEQTITEENVISGTPIGYITAPGAIPPVSLMAQFMVMLMMLMISVNLVFLTLKRGNLSMPAIPKIKLPKLPKKGKDVSVDKINEVINKGRIREEPIREEKSDEQIKQEEIRKNIDEIINREKGKEKRNKLMMNKVARVKNNIVKKKVEKVLINKGDEKKGSFMPYDYLIDASKVISFIHNNRKPRIELIEDLGKKYPLFLVDLGIRAVYSSKNLEHSYCNKSFDHIQPDTEIYTYVTYWNLVKAVKVMAEKLSLDKMERYNSKEVKSILFNKWNKDKPLVAFLYKEFF